MTLTFGATPVPYTVTWTAEEAVFLGPCQHAGGRVAFRQPSAPGQGRPLFGRPHGDRQREAVARDLCDLCGRPLKNRTKVSLSHARPRPGALGLCVMQVEPLLHKACAAESVRWCPSLRRDLKRGTTQIRQVMRHRVEFALIDPRHVDVYAPGKASAEPVVGHAKVILLAWKDRPIEWLTEGDDG